MAWLSLVVYYVICVLINLINAFLVIQSWFPCLSEFRGLDDAWEQYGSLCVPISSIVAFPCPNGQHINLDGANTITF